VIGIADGSFIRIEGDERIKNGRHLQEARVKLMERHPEVHDRQKNPERNHHEIVGKPPHQMHTNDSHISMNNKGILVFLVASNLNGRYIQ
jgi:hypothetical protein